MVGHAVDTGGTVTIRRIGKGGRGSRSDNNRQISVGGGRGGRPWWILSCFPEFGVGLTDVGMMGAEETGNVIARISILIVTAHDAAMIDYAVL